MLLADSGSKTCSQGESCVCYWLTQAQISAAKVRVVCDNWLTQAQKPAAKVRVVCVIWLTQAQKPAAKVRVVCVDWLTQAQKSAAKVSCCCPEVARQESQILQTPRSNKEHQLYHSGLMYTQCYVKTLHGMHGILESI